MSAISDKLVAALVDDGRMRRITTERLVLRRLEASDASDVFGVFSDPEVMKYWSSPPLADLPAAEQLVAETHRLFEQRTLFQWGLARRSDDRVLGTFTLHRLDEGNLRAEVGYALAREVWRQGYMREALTAAISFAFESLGLMRLEADVDPDNAASVGLLERLGFQREGLLRERWRVGGGVQHSLMLGILRREWGGGS